MDAVFLAFFDASPVAAATRTISFCVPDLRRDVIMMDMRDGANVRLQRREAFVGNAASCLEWQEKANFRTGFERMNLATQLKVCRALGVEVRCNYNHDARRFVRPETSYVAQVLADHFTRLIGAAATAQPVPKAAPQPRPLAEAIREGDAIFGEAQDDDDDDKDNDTSSSEGGTASSMFHPAVAPTEAATATAAQPTNDDTWEWRITMTKPEAEVIVEHSLSLEAWSRIKGTLTEGFEDWFAEHDVKAMFEGAIEGINSSDSEGSAQNGGNGSIA
jgi:hypothetical protein